MSALVALLLAALCIPAGLVTIFARNDSTAVVAFLLSGAFLSSAFLVGMT